MTRAALAICPEPPYPLAGGGAIRTASLLEYLARRYALDLILFRRPGDPNPAAALPAGLARKVWVLHLAAHGRSLPVRMARNASRLLRGAPPLLDRFSGFAGEIGEIARQGSWDLAVIEHFWCAPYWEQVAPRSRRTVLDLHNIESLWHQRCARAQGGAAGLALAAFARRCLQLEARWLPRFTSVLAPSEPDCAAIGGIAPGCRAFAYANALPPAVKRAEREVRNDIVFSGNLAYHPNILAVRYFRREIWPLLRARWPGLEWRLVGKNPQAVMRHVAGDERIRLSGPVENAVAELARAKVAVAPLLAGSGTRV
ncbi:MAG: glycosyltransferase, partial [Acidobacteria bacterium]|nr:glycosyltransferase [Acidobacteriota bacterium]